jgi:hypothetical protein
MWGEVVLRSDFETSSVRSTGKSKADAVEMTGPDGRAVDVPIFYEAGSAGDRIAQVTDDPVAPGNKALRFWLKRAVIPGQRSGRSKGRVQIQIQPPASKELFVRYRIYLHPDLAALRSYPLSNDWFTVSAMRSGRQGDPHVFRITLNLRKDAGVGAPLRFVVSGDKRTGGRKGHGKWSNVWGDLNTRFDVPTGIWMNVELGYKLGDAAAGRFYLAVRPEGAPAKEVIFDVADWTYHPGAPRPVPASLFHVFKLYTSGDIVDFVRAKGGAAQIYWDDLEVLDAWPAPADRVEVRIPGMFFPTGGRL